MRYEKNSRDSVIVIPEWEGYFLGVLLGMPGSKKSFLDPLHSKLENGGFFFALSQA